MRSASSCRAYSWRSTSELSAGPLDAYERAVVADHAFLMAVPMWIVAAAVGLVGESLFPDRTDYRILMAEPLSRLTIFGSKLASLLLFGGLFVAGTHLALLPLAALTMIGAMKTGALVTTAMAFVFSSRARKPFRCPGDRCRPRASRAGCAASAADRVLRRGEELPDRRPRACRCRSWRGCRPRPARFRRTHGGLPWAPPAWFVALERWLIGDASRAALAAEAAIGTVVVLIVSVASYVLLYRRFDRVTVQSSPSQNIAGLDRSLARWNGRAPVRRAIGRFVAITIRRSVLHQGLVVGALAAAGAFVLNSLLSADGWRGAVR